MSVAPLPSPPPPPLPPPRRQSPPAPTPSPPPIARTASFWARTKQSTVGAWDTTKWGLSRSTLSTSNPPSTSIEQTLLPPDSSLESESIKAAKILRTFTWDAADLPQGGEVSFSDRRKSQIVVRKIPEEAVVSSTGVAIFTAVKTGTLFGSKGGSGVVLARLPDGTWSPPAAILLESVGFGFLAGVEMYDVVLLLRNDQAVESFTRPRITLGSEISIAAGPVGNGMELDELAQQSAVWSYTKSKALQGGVQLDGSVLVERSDENAQSYGQQISSEEILNGAVRPAPWCTGLHQTILAAEGSDFRPELIPQGPSPSECFLASASTDDDKVEQPTTSPPLSPPISPDPSILSQSSIRRLPKEELSEEDLAAKRELEEAMRSFGIEDPTVYERSRLEDPNLVIEERPESGDDSFEVESQTPALTRSRGSQSSGRTENEEVQPEVEGGKEILTDEVENPPNNDDTTPTSDTLESINNEKTGVVREEKRQDETGNVESVPASPSLAKPPVPPRRTPRIPAPASPVVGHSQEEAVTQEETPAEEKKETEGQGEAEKGTEEEEQNNVEDSPPTDKENHDIEQKEEKQ